MLKARMPMPALVLGVSGSVPFVALTSAIAFGPERWYGYWLMSLSYYGAVILTFVGALHWAYALKRDAPCDEAWLQYGFSVAQAVMAWLSLLFPVWTALRMQAAALLLCYVFDVAMRRIDPIPVWFMRLRAGLTSVAVTSLILASVA